jgi:hypothetical protein
MIQWVNKSKPPVRDDAGDHLAPYRGKQKSLEEIEIEKLEEILEED